MKIASVPRRDGETAFPEVATILTMIRTVQTERRIAEAASAKVREWAERVKWCEEHPEEREKNEEVLQAIERLNAKIGIDPKVYDSVTSQLVTCPHCHQELPIAGNIRFWTPTEMREYADALETAQTLKVASLVDQETLDRMAKVKAEMEYTR